MEEGVEIDTVNDDRKSARSQSRGGLRSSAFESKAVGCMPMDGLSIGGSTRKTKIEEAIEDRWSIERRDVSNDVNEDDQC